MKGAPIFIISFDCEGKWGMADHITPEIDAKLTNRALEQVYARIVDMLDARGVRATFAFVGTFTLHPDQAPSYLEKLPEVKVGGVAWLERFYHDFRAGRHEGWFVPGALDKVRKSGAHELATHGFSHVPLGETIVTRAQFTQEISLARELAATQGWRPRTIIYPRNQIGYVDELPRQGIHGYRACLWPGRAGFSRQVSYLAAELGFFAHAQPSYEPRDPLPIPAGHILNFWHNRTRRLISRQTTVRRWKSIVNHAILTRQVAHLWSHPHNFISDPGLFDVLDEILSHVQVACKDGKIINSTQADMLL